MKRYIELIADPIHSKCSRSYYERRSWLHIRVHGNKTRCANCGGRGRFVNPMTGQTVICDWCDGTGETQA